MQSVFKTAGAGQGFHRFMLGDSTPVKVLQVDDVVELNPFEGASNRTSVVVLEKAYELVKRNEGKALGNVEEEIDQRVAELWDITKTELEEIKRCLAEIG